MNLHRLRIDQPSATTAAPATGASGSSRRRRAAAGVVLFLLGLLAGYILFARGPGTSGGAGRVVRTAVAGAGGGSTTAGFTAGGWVEVATPRYPLYVSGRITQTLERVAVKEGDAVAPGQPLAWLYDVDARAKLAAAEARLGRVRAAAGQMKAGYREEEVRAGAARARETAEQARLAAANLERARRVAEGALSAEELDGLQSAATAAAAVQAAAEAELDKLRKGYRAEEIEAAAADVREAEAQRRLAELELSYCTIFAPTNTPPLRVLNVLRRPGEWVGMGREAAVVSLYDPRDLQVRVDVPQGNVRRTRVGGRAVVRVDANPDREYPARVVRVDPLAELAKNTVTVRLAIEEPDDLLFPEMVAHVVFLPAEASPEPASAGTFPVVPASAVVRGEGGAAHVFVVEGGMARRVAVETGEPRGGGSLDIRRGVTSGQRVVVSPPAGLKDGERVQEAD